MLRMIDIDKAYFARVSRIVHHRDAERVLTDGVGAADIPDDERVHCRISSTVGNKR
jgi:hypothetical protein